MLDKSKSARQEQAISTWKDNGYKGTFQHIMRFGKTREAELVIERTRANNNGNKRILFIVPTEIAYQNVAKICKAHNVELYTISQYINRNKEMLIKDECFLLIIDEIHRLLNDKHVAYLKNIKASFKLGLTGAKLTKDDKTNLRILGMPVIDVITDEEAVFRKWITEYDEYNVSVDISEVEKIKIKALNDKIDSIAIDFKDLDHRINQAFKRSVFSGTFDLLQSCYSGKSIKDKITFEVKEFIAPEKVRLILCSLMGYRKDYIIENEHDRRVQTFWNPNNVQQLAKDYIRAIQARNDYFKHNISKVNAVMKLSTNFPRPTIVYNDSIPMIDQLYESIRIPRVKYHSQIESVPAIDEFGEPILYKSGEKKGQQKVIGKSLQKKLAIESIRSGEALYLITGKSLNESLDLPNIEFVICTSGDTNTNTYDQRVARGKTINPDNANKKCTIINLFIDDFFLNFEFIRSRDKEKLISRQNNVKSVVWFENIDDFICHIKNNV